MIKNIVFDLGNVLMDFEPLKYLETLGFPEEKCKLMATAIFGNRAWVELDRGTVSPAEAVGIMCAGCPGLENDIRGFFKEHWPFDLPIRSSVADYLKGLKDRGFSIYILSNFSKEWYEFMIPKMYFLKYTDGQVVSNYIKLIKPDKEIYMYLLSKFNLNPSETAFIDDLKQNTEAAESVGITGIVYDCLPNVIKKLEALF